MSLSYLSINDLILVALIGAALFLDLSQNRIPNYLTFPAIGWGLVFYTVTGGFSGLWFSLLGLLVGIAIFFIPFAMGGVGAGDVKLLGAVGALQGWQFVLTAGLLTAVVGGVMALIYLLVNRNFLRVLKKMAGFVLAPFFSALFYRTNFDLFSRASVYFARPDPEANEAGRARMPYGAAIAAGVLFLLAMNLFPWGEPFISSLPWQ